MTPFETTPEETASWWVMLETTRVLTRSEQARLQAWLDSDQMHSDVYQRTRATAARLARHDRDPAFDAIRAEALRYGGAVATARRRWLAPAAALAASLALLAVFVGIHDPGLVIGPDRVQYRTSIGERSTVMLPDGSEMSLNTDSLVRVAYSEVERHIELLQGEAHFDVAPMPSRPFVVQAGERRVTAVGTSFDVRLAAEGTPLRVTLLDGHVVVDDSLQAAAPRTELKAGERLTALPDGAAWVETIDVTRAMAWRDGRLMIESADLAELVREANRYSKVKLVIADPQLAKLKVGGVFKVGRPAGIAEALASHLPLQYRVERDRVLLLSRN